MVNFYLNSLLYESDPYIYQDDKDLPIRSLSDYVNPNNVLAPIPGKLLRMERIVGDFVQKGDVICIISAMKMELEVLAHKNGKITQVFLDVEENFNIKDNICKISSE